MTRVVRNANIAPLQRGAYGIITVEGGTHHEQVQQHDRGGIALRDLGGSRKRQVRNRENGALGWRWLFRQVPHVRRVPEVLQVPQALGVRVPVPRWCDALTLRRYNGAGMVL